MQNAPTKPAQLPASKKRIVWQCQDLPKLQGVLPRTIKGLTDWMVSQKWKMETAKHMQNICVILIIWYAFSTSYWTLYSITYLGCTRMYYISSWLSRFHRKANMTYLFSQLLLLGEDGHPQFLFSSSRLHSRTTVSVELLHFAYFAYKGDFFRSTRLLQFFALETDLPQRRPDEKDIPSLKENKFLKPCLA